jgi:oligopeptide/dipeptide ABC transporter ATP-binding protein
MDHNFHVHCELKRISEMDGSAQVLLSIRNLRVDFYTYAGVVKALNGVDLDIMKGETLGVVGETGCGKSVTARAITLLVPPPGKITKGAIWYQGDDLVTKSEEEMRHIRGKKISMVFQDPMTYLNPLYTIGEQIAEVILLHQDVNGSKSQRKKKALDSVVQALRMVNLPDPEKVVHQYPHELSGGMRQRAIIAMALACNPDLLIADEPTTALDVTIRAQILELLMQLKQRLNMTILMITHDMGTVARTCDRVAVMYAGNIVELAQTRSLFKNPKHPYTVGLLKSIPKIVEETRELASIPGSVPDLISPPSGCRFHPRCSYVRDICLEEEPKLIEIEPAHHVMCHIYGKPECFREMN